MLAKSNLNGPLLDFDGEISAGKAYMWTGVREDNVATLWARTWSSLRVKLQRRKLAPEEGYGIPPIHVDRNGDMVHVRLTYLREEASPQ